MSQRAAWQLERLGFADVYDFVLGKAHWLASGRPTMRREQIERVGDSLFDVQTADPDDTAANVAARIPDGTDVVVIDERGIVLGRAMSGDLSEASTDQTVADIMRIGPTTIRPDEVTAAVRKRMKSRRVTSVLVTRPTGVLLGQYEPFAKENS